MQGFSWGHEVD